MPAYKVYTKAGVVYDPVTHVAPTASSFFGVVADKPLMPGQFVYVLDLQNKYTMDKAPRDGTMLSLLVKYEPDDDEAHPTADADVAWTIGFNNFLNNGEDKWHMAGWDWGNDEFTKGEGEPIGWLPFPPPISTLVDTGHAVKSDTSDVYHSHALNPVMPVIHKVDVVYKSPTATELVVRWVHDGVATGHYELRCVWHGDGVSKSLKFTKAVSSDHEYEMQMGIGYAKKITVGVRAVSIAGTKSEEHITAFVVGEN